MAAGPRYAAACLCHPGFSRWFLGCGLQPCVASISKFRGRVFPKLGRVTRHRRSDSIHRVAIQSRAALESRTAIRAGRAGEQCRRRNVGQANSDFGIIRIRRFALTHCVVPTSLVAAVSRKWPRIGFTVLQPRLIPSRMAFIPRAMEFIVLKPRPIPFRMAFIPCAMGFIVLQTRLIPSAMAFIPRAMG